MGRTSPGSPPPPDLRNRIVRELSSGWWVRVDELAVSLDVDLRRLVPLLTVLREQGHVETDGRGVSAVAWVEKRQAYP